MVIAALPTKNSTHTSAHALGLFSRLALYLPKGQGSNQDVLRTTAGTYKTLARTFQNILEHLENFLRNS